jgi:uncharacterized membrane protein
MIWICNVLVFDLFVFWICIFFLINILDLYLDLLILYQKAKDQKIIKVFFGKIKIRSKTGSKPKLKSGFKTVSYKHNNR